MSDIDNQSRSNKFEKRRKNTKKISILMIIASILIVILLAIWLFGGKEKDTSTPDTDTPESESMAIEGNPNSDNQDENSSEVNEEAEDLPNENFENDIDEDLEINENGDIEVEIEQVDPSDDDVIEAYTGDWPPVGTEQEGAHTTNYNDGSQDRIEIKQAIMSVTGLSEDLIEHWIGNGGDQKVIATVANQENLEFYRIYLSWIDNQGWQVTKVERLKEI